MKAVTVVVVEVVVHQHLESDNSERKSAVVLPLNRGVKCCVYSNL
jgi:hypothetical protein